MAVVTKYGKEKWADNGRGRLAIGSDEGQFRPYDLLYSGLSSCFYYTLESLAKKMKLSYEEVTITVDGHKRDEKVAMLDNVYFKIEALGVIEEEKFIKACELAGKYCSIHATIAKVAKMHHEIIFL